MNRVLKVIVCFIIIASITGCSAYIRMKTYVPTEGTEWKLLTEAKGNSSRCIGEYESNENNVVAINQCGEFKVRFNKITHSSLSIVGPPIIPIIPIPSGYNGFFEIYIERNSNIESGASTIPECPSIDVIKPESVTATIQNTALYQKENKAKCWYKLTKTDSEIVILKVVFKELECDSSMLVLKQQVESGYAALCSISF